MKSHVKRPGYASALATRSCARFSPSSVIPASASTPSSSSGDVLDGGEDLDLGWDRVPRRAISRADALEVLAHPLGAQPADQLNHAIPAWRPVRPRSRRCEKNSDGPSRSCRARRRAPRSTPARSSSIRAIAFRSRLRPLPDVRAVGPRTRRGPPRRPRSSTAPRRARSPPRAASSAPSSRTAATPSATTPAASPRQPACTIATAPSPAIAIGRQSAVSTIARRRRWPSPGRRPRGGSSPCAGRRAAARATTAPWTWRP